MTVAEDGSEAARITVPHDTLIIGRFHDLQQGIPALRMAIRQEKEWLEVDPDVQSCSEQMSCLDAIESWLAMTEEKTINDIRCTWPFLVEAYNSTFNVIESERQEALRTLAASVIHIQTCKNALNKLARYPGESEVFVPSEDCRLAVKQTRPNEDIFADATLLVKTCIRSSDKSVFAANAETGILGSLWRDTSEVEEPDPEALALSSSDDSRSLPGFGYDQRHSELGDA